MAVNSIVFLLLTFSSAFQKSNVLSSYAGPEKSATAMFVPVCAKPGPRLRRIGWGRFGLQFDFPTREVQVLGGKPDVDYVRYVIKPKTGDGYLELWFGPYAFSFTPDVELLENSVETQKREITNSSSEQIGKDNSGKLKSGEVWRHTFLMLPGAEGARYKTSHENAPPLDRIVDSACYIPSPR